MYAKETNQWTHSHDFSDNLAHAERSTQRVIVLTLSMMVIEIIAGLTTGSMALLADGWHMGTHAAALGITAFAYSYARRHAGNPRYSFGTGKVGVLGGFASAIVLALVALFMIVESTKRLISPITIKFEEAIIVAVVGLVVNLVSAYLLRDRHHHSHDHGSHQGHTDHNLKAAYLHVLADAMTSVLAIVGLAAGRTLGWLWMDPLVGIAGALVIAKWSHGLLRDTGSILLDSGVDQEIVSSIRQAIERDSDDQVIDLHVWPLSSQKLAAIVSVETRSARRPSHYKKLLADFHDLAHVTVEVNAHSTASSAAD